MNQPIIITEVFEFTPEMQQAIAKHVKENPKTKHCQSVVSTELSDNSLLKDFHSIANQSCNN